MERNLVVSLEQAKTLYSVQPELRPFLLTTFSLAELTRTSTAAISWKALGEIEGCYITTDCEIIPVKDFPTYAPNQNVFSTLQEAESSIAMAKLTQLKARLGKECIVNWTDCSMKKVIVRSQDTVQLNAAYSTYCFLAFNTKAVCLQFMEDHKDLIKQYFML